METEIRMAGPADLDAILQSEDVFDAPPQRAWTREVLADPRHHLAIGTVDGAVVGFLSGVHYLHPDKAPQMWINEVGVSDTHQRRGIGRRLVECIETMARHLTCSEIWVLSDPTDAALGFYTALGWDREGQHIALFSKELS